MNILIMGACHIDFVYSVEHIVRKGETLSSKSLKQSPGGKGLNQAIAVARAGSEVYLAGCIGDDGLFLKELVEQSGVNTEYLKVVSEKTGHAIIQVEESAENSIILYDGTDAMVDDTYVDEVLGHFGEGDYLILQNEINNIPYIVGSAYAKGMKIVFNPSPYNEKIKEVDLRKLAWMIVNEVESKDITGDENPTEAFRILKERYPNLEVVITLGKRGCLYTEGTEIKRQRAYEVKTVDTTGAGDTFTGYFYAGVTSGKTHSESAKQAALASAISTTKHGAAISIPTMEEVMGMSVDLEEFAETASERQKRIEKIEHYIEENIASATLSDVAELMNYSVAYMSRWIGKNMNGSYNDLLQKKRCQFAAKLLRETELPISDIIAKTGYQNENFFRSKFRDMYGKNPKQFREYYKNIG